MEQNLPVFAKKVWNLVRVVYFMLRKGISKRKLLLDLNMMIKRGKIAGKALQNLMFHHHHHHINRAAFTTHHLSFPSSPPPGEYEFSCNNSPATGNHPFSLFSLHKKHQSSGKPSKEHLDMRAMNAVFRAMEMIHSENSSPALPGFGSTLMVRQLRVTDSPFPLSSVDEDNQVNEAAEQFISRFYSDLRLQNNKAASFGSSS